jgi:replication-associated recombination protein RarA
MTAMWSDRYRPKCLSDCVLDHLDSKDRLLLEHSMESPQIPNVILYGPPGTGKTTIARILCDEDRFTVNDFNGSLLEKHGVESIERLIVSTNLFHKARCLLIDEIDGSTEKAQLALRALTQETRVPVSWICTANSIRKLNPALLSRMIQIDCSFSSHERRMAHLAGIANRCRVILNAESMHDVPDDDIREIVELNYPDVRQTINVLQATFSRRLAA